MKILILGVSRRTGISDDGKGSPYDIARINTLQPITSRDNAHNKFIAAGFRGGPTAEVELEPNAINEFLGLKYPAEYEVDTDSRLGQGGLITVVTGLKKA